MFGCGEDRTITMFCFHEDLREFCANFIYVHNSQNIYGNEKFSGQKFWRESKYTVSFQCTFPSSLGVLEILTSHLVTLHDVYAMRMFSPICVLDVKFTGDRYFWQYLKFIFRPVNPTVAADKWSYFLFKFPSLHLCEAAFPLSSIKL
jgi:hypothetical protein